MKSLAEIDNVLTTAFKREFWLNLQEEFEASYQAANTSVTGTALKLGRAEIARLRPQTRHYTLNCALKRAAMASGYPFEDIQTKPKGENYVIISSSGIKITRIGQCHDNGSIKYAKHRSIIAELNQDYECYTPDFFNSSESNIDNSLGILLINVHPPLSMDQDRMLDLRVVVPYANLKGSHYNRSIKDVQALYNKVTETVLLDKAIPVLRKRLKEQEG